MNKHYRVMLVTGAVISRVFALLRSFAKTCRKLPIKKLPLLPITTGNSRITFHQLIMSYEGSLFRNCFHLGLQFKDCDCSDQLQGVPGPPGPKCRKSLKKVVPGRLAAPVAIQRTLTELLFS